MTGILYGRDDGALSFLQRVRCAPCLERLDLHALIVHCLQTVAQGRLAESSGGQALKRSVDACSGCGEGGARSGRRYVDRGARRGNGKGELRLDVGDLSVDGRRAVWHVGDAHEYAIELRLAVAERLLARRELVEQICAATMRVWAAQR